MSNSLGQDQTLSNSSADLDPNCLAIL